MRRCSRLVLTLPVVLLAAVLFSAAPAHASGFTINSFVDAPDTSPGDRHCDSDAGQTGDQCSLRAAIMEENAIRPQSASLSLPSGTYTLTIPPGGNNDDGATGDLDVTTTMGFYGTPGSTIIKAGNGFGDRIFDIPSGSGTITFNGVTIQGGTAPGNGDGGGIRDMGAKSVALVNVSLLQNHADGGSGGGMYVATGSATTVTANIVTADSNTAGVNGGGIDVEGGVTATLNRLTITNNRAQNGGGLAAFMGASPTGFATIQFTSTVSGNTATGAGGGMAVGRFSVANTTISNNTATNGGGVELVNAGKPSSISGRNYISDNVATSNGGGIYAADCGTSCGMVFNTNINGNNAKDGSGVYVTDGLTISNSSVYQNDAAGGSNGGAVFHTGAASYPLAMTNVTVNTNTGGPFSSSVVLMSPATDVLSFTTIDANTGGAADAIYVGGSAGSPQVKSTIVSGDGPNCAGSITSMGYNLETADTCGFNKSTDHPTTNPKLETGPVADDNGGFTRTRLLLPGSPAIDAGPSTGCLSTDGRWVMRPQGPKCDIGAYEVGPGTRNSDVQLLGLTASPNPVAKGSDVTYTMTVKNTGPQSTFATYLIDNLPSTLVYKSCSPAPNCSVVGNIVKVTWSTGLETNQPVTVTIVATVPTSITQSSVTNTVVSYSDNPDHYPISNTAATTVTIQ